LPPSASSESSHADRESQSHNIGRVARNSFFLTAQPLFLNVLSLLAVAYIARTLGVADFGIFNLVTTYVMLFTPLAQVGLNRVMVRDLAPLDDKAAYTARMLPLRVLITGLAAVAIVATAVLAGYDSRTTMAIIAGCSIFLAQMLAEIFGDMFVATERIHFAVITQLVGGLTLTILSVAVLYVGLGLFSMIGAYAFGQSLGLVLLIYFAHKNLFRLQWRPDTQFAARKLMEGLPFFASTMMWSVTSRIDTIVLSKRSTPEELGLYTAAMLLVARMGIVPQGVSTALLPVMSRLFGTGDAREASSIIRRISDTLVIFVLPAVVFVSAFSTTITSVLFGSRYVGAGIVLAIGVWILLCGCIVAVQFSVLAGSMREKAIMKSYAVTTVYCVASNWILVQLYGMIGAAAASLSTQVLLAVLFAWHSPVRAIVSRSVLLKTLALSAAMLLAVFATGGWNVWYSMGFVVSIAAGGAFAIGLVRLDQLRWLSRTFARA
jgi:polysaccharide transporter, PST family